MENWLTRVLPPQKPLCKFHADRWDRAEGAHPRGSGGGLGRMPHSICGKSHSPLGRPAAKASAEALLGELARIVH
jgi:hypothetical protein